jgi:hypothetical protein
VSLNGVEELSQEVQKTSWEKLGLHGSPTVTTASSTWPSSLDLCVEGCPGQRRDARVDRAGLDLGTKLFTKGNWVSGGFSKNRVPGLGGDLMEFIRGSCQRAICPAQEE